MNLYLSFLDQFRYMAGSLVICLMLCRQSLPPRKPYLPRLAGSSAVCLALAFVYVPLQRILSPVSARFPLIIAPYWLLMSFILVWFVRFTHEASPALSLFLTMMGAFAEGFVSILIRNLFVYTVFPDFPEQHPFLYTLFLAAVYLIFCRLLRLTLIRRIRSDASVYFSGSRSAAVLFLFIYLSYTALLSTSKYVMETLILPVSHADGLSGVYRYLQLYLVGVMLLLSVIMSVVMWYIHQNLTLAAEKEVILRLARDRKAQYEFSRENIEMINRKTHDLKHQLQALAFVSDEEKNRQIEETSRAIDFYDAVVKTGNEALDVLLTEKSVYCANRRIRLSCTVTTRQLDKIRLMDLYTLLGNALDNAIESVEALQEQEQKIISLSIQDQGSMLYIQLENYYSGSLSMHGGLPATRKKDAQNHGYGLKSIQSIVHSYGGKLEIRTEGQIFSLEIMIP